MVHPERHSSGEWPPGPSPPPLPSTPPEAGPAGRVSHLAGGKAEPPADVPVSTGPVLCRGPQGRHSPPTAARPSKAQISLGPPGKLVFHSEGAARKTPPPCQRN